MYQTTIHATNYDSVLYTERASNVRNADLYLIVRVYLDRIDPDPGQASPLRRLTATSRPLEPRLQRGTAQDLRNTVLTDRWPETEWRSFRQRFKDAVEAKFSNKMWLVPDRDWGFTFRTQEQPARVFRPNLKCMVRVDLVNTKDEAHLTCRCVHLQSGQFFRSYMNRHSHEGKLDNNDVDSRGGQVAVEHEIGHYLGLSHVGHFTDACRSGTDSRQCYCPNELSCTDLMGEGAVISGWHFRPWEVRLRDHLTGRAREARWTRSLLRRLPVQTATIQPVRAQDAGV
jgi:hypothetical protein